MVETTIKICLPCQASTQGTSPPPEPLQPTPLPEKARNNVAVDFVGPFPTGEYLIVVIDEYSRYPEVEILTTTSAKAAIPKLGAIFSRQGIPEILKSDNGPPFNSEEFTNFANLLGFKHRKIPHTGQEPTAQLNASRKLSKKPFELPQLKVGTGNKPCTPSFASIVPHHIAPPPYLLAKHSITAS